jgi:hypothetical protein
MVKGNTINTLHPVKKSGVVMHEIIYQMISEFILSTIQKENELTITGLLEEADINFPDPLEGNLSWHLYHVKLDLEARGLLQFKMIETDTHRKRQVLRLTKKGMARFRQLVK